MKEINRFREQYFFLSNFYLVDVYYDGFVYPSVEHAYQAAKTLDLKERERIGMLFNPAEAKQEGKYLIKRPNWQKMKLKIMYDLVKQKFSKNILLKKKLLNTKDALLIEGNYWQDTYWGICNGIGENNLGKILMKVRRELK